MRTRLNKWLDIKTMCVLYGIDVLVGGKWHHAHRDGRPLIFRTEKRAVNERLALSRLQSLGDIQRVSEDSQQ